MQTLKVGVIGAGFIGRQHIEAIRRIPGCEVAAIADIHADTAKRAAEELSIPMFHSSPEALLADDFIVVVHNCTPTSSHFDVNKAALAAGKHVYCEKPLTLTAAEADELAALAQKSNGTTGVNFNYRHNAMVKEMRARASADLGRIFSVYGEYLQDWLMYDTDYDWRMKPELGGESRAVADIGSHCFDTLQYITGRKIVAVYAKLINIFPVRKRCESAGQTFSGSSGKVVEEIPVPSEDAAFIIMRFDDGMHGLVNLTQVCAGKKNGLAVTVSGAEYSMEWHQERADRLWLGHRQRPNEELYADARLLTPFAAQFATLPSGHAVAWHDAFRNGIDVFYNAIRSGDGEKRDYPDFTDGARIMHIVEACLESNRRSMWVDVV